MTARRAGSGDALHLEVARFLDAALPAGAFWHHSPNEGLRHVAYRVKLAARGTRSGFPDILVLHGGRAFLVELKSGRGRLTDGQRAAAVLIAAAGCPFGTASSVAEVAGLLGSWGLALRVSAEQWSGRASVPAGVARELLSVPAIGRRAGGRAAATRSGKP